MGYGGKIGLLPPKIQLDFRGNSIEWAMVRKLSLLAQEKQENWDVKSKFYCYALVNKK